MRRRGEKERREGEERRRGEEIRRGENRRREGKKEELENKQMRINLTGTTGMTGLYLCSLCVLLPVPVLLAVSLPLRQLDVHTVVIPDQILLQAWGCLISGRLAATCSSHPGGSRQGL